MLFAAVAAGQIDVDDFVAVDVDLKLVVVD
jgi:hypothetical protein